MSHSSMTVSGSGSAVPSRSRRDTEREREIEDRLLDMLLTYAAIKV